MHLKLWGKSPVVTCLGDTSHLPADAASAREKAIAAGVPLAPSPPPSCDLCIDALFGIGPIRPWNDECADWIQKMNTGPAQVLAVDIPSGLRADTGEATPLHVKAHVTLSLLTLKPGLFTADGRESCGEIWFNDLGVRQSDGACARLNSPPLSTHRAHNTHKGSYGDVCIVGGSHGMTGAAILAARGALHGGAGRVYVGLIDPATVQWDTAQPELMFRNLKNLNYPSLTVVAGCGGGDTMGEYLVPLLSQAWRLVLDADALNAIAKDTKLQEMMAARAANSTVLTPHPLEAARLLGCSTADIQANRLGAVQAIADRWACTVVLKGSGTIIAAPDELPCINPTGNAHLATAGTGDVLAGLIGAQLAAGKDTFACACESAFLHGKVGEQWASASTFTANALALAL
jgi:hydroxyethylthiazole kinase-like uncharacterized protein yjeF